MNSSNPEPLVLLPVFIVAVSNAPLEALALRGVLEAFNYHVETHWIGSRRLYGETSP